MCVCVCGGERDPEINFPGRRGQLSLGPAALTHCHQSLTHCPYTHVPAPLGARAAPGQLAVKCFSGSSYRAAALTSHFAQQLRFAAGVSNVLSGVWYQYWARSWSDPDRAEKLMFIKSHLSRLWLHVWRANKAKCTDWMQSLNPSVNVWCQLSFLLDLFELKWIHMQINLKIKVISQLHSQISSYESDCKQWQVPKGGSDLDISYHTLDIQEAPKHWPMLPEARSLVSIW